MTITSQLKILKVLADWKRAAMQDWVRTGVPVILDVSNGFDGKIVWANAPTARTLLAITSTYNDTK
jgi:hypothetical protein